MKLKLLAVSLLAIALLASAFGRQTGGSGQLGYGLIQAANSNASTAAPSAGSYTAVTLAPGQNACFADVSGTYVAQFHVYVLYPTGPLRQLPDALLTTPFSGVTGIPANGTGLWQFNATGPGTLYLACSAYTSGSAQTVLGCGPGGAGGLSSISVGGSTISSSNPLPTFGSVYFGTFNVPSTVQTANNTSGATLISTSTSPLAKRYGVTVVNLGTSDLWISPFSQSGTATMGAFYVPAGTDRTLPIGTGVSLYAETLVSGSSTTFFCLESTL